jgi:hypothetical protein
MSRLPPVLCFTSLPVIFVAFAGAGFVACVVGAAYARADDCELNTFALARVVAKEPRTHFVAARGEQTPACPSTETICRRKAYVVPGDEVLIGTAGGPYVCAVFKSQRGAETTGWLPRLALELVPPALAPARQWAGKWRRDQGAQIAIKSSGDDVEVSGDAIWGSHDPQRVRRGAVHVGVLEGKGRPRGQTLAIGYDPERSSFPSNDPPEDCAAKLELLGRYLTVEDNKGCGGINVSFTGIYVRAK